MISIHSINVILDLARFLEHDLAPVYKYEGVLLGSLALRCFEHVPSTASGLSSVFLEDALDL